MIATKKLISVHNFSVYIFNIKMIKIHQAIYFFFLPSLMLSNDFRREPYVIFVSIRILE